MRTWSWLAVALTLAACAVESPGEADDRRLGDEVIGQARGETEPGPVNGAVSREPEPAPFDPAWPLTVTGIGPIHVGMSVEETVEALSGTVDVPEGLGGCEYISPHEWPEGIAVMVTDGRIARVDVWKGEIATAEGVRIGSTEQEVHARYPERIEVRPHKYTDGNYLILTPVSPDGAEYRIVFETDGERVVRYRAGVLPEVEWVEGCG